MGSAIVLDTETTGLDKPDVIELAFLGPFSEPNGWEFYKRSVQRFRPRKPISLGAMAVHHIIDSDLANCEEWRGAWEPPDELGEIDFLIGHNVDHDWAAIGSPDVKRICTLALSRMVWPLLDSHSLGALIYHIHADKDVARKNLKLAHGALPDVEMCFSLLLVLLGLVGNPMTWDEVWRISEKARIPKFFQFGKYGPANYPPTGKEVAWVKANDRGYVKWCLGTKDMDPYLIAELSR